MRARRTLVAVLLPMSLLAAACGGGGDDDAEAPTTSAGSDTTAAPDTTAEPTTTTVAAPAEVFIRPMFVLGDGSGGGLGDETVSVAPSPDDTLRVEFSENEVSGLGDSSRAASWNAVTVASILSGAPLTGAYKFTIDGRIDGPSAGALKTVAVLSLLYGDEIADDITMTGTINPDGTVGPVGGIPEKVQGAIDEGLARVLIPVGLRNSVSAGTGELVDVVDLGRRAGIEVQEVSTVYEAYEEFTGQPLPKLDRSGDTRLDDNTYDRLKAEADGFLASYQESISAFLALDPSIQELLIDLAVQAEDAANRASSLSTQGLQAGAFGSATEAAALADAAAGAGQAVQILFTQGVDPFLTRVSQSQAIEGQVFSLLDSLKTFEPGNVSDASSLMNAYANALDAYSVAQFAGNQLDSYTQDLIDGVPLEEVLPNLVLPLVFFEVAGTQVDVAESLFDVGRDLDGPPISGALDLASTADFFRKASDANFAAFQATVVKNTANDFGISEDRALGLFANADIDVALSLSQRNVIEGLQQYIGEGEPNAEYALLGFGISNYARNAGLIEKYYSNGITDENLEVVDVQSQAALTAGLELGKEQLEATIGLLQEQDVQPALQAGALESANLDREGDIADKFSALNSYWAGFLSGRVLAYLGGFETEGLDRTVG